jgi:hypothetical protein
VRQEGMFTGRATDIDHPSEPDLSDDSSELSTGGGNPVCGGSVTSREDFTGNHKRRGVGSKVLEKVGKAVKRDKGVFSCGSALELVVPETHYTEDGSEEYETHQLDGFPSPFIDEEKGGPVSGNETTDGEDDVTDRNVFQVLGDLFRSRTRRGRSESDGGQDDRGVQTETVESYVQDEPGQGSPEQDLSVLPLSKVLAEILPGGFRSLDPLLSGGFVLLISPTGQESLDVGSSTSDILLDVQSVSGGFGDGQSEIKSQEGGDGTEPEQDTPTDVDVFMITGCIVDDMVLEPDGDTESDDGS